MGEFPPRRSNAPCPNRGRCPPARPLARNRRGEPGRRSPGDPRPGSDDEHDVAADARRAGGHLPAERRRIEYRLRGVGRSVRWLLGDSGMDPIPPSLPGPAAPRELDPPVGAPGTLHARRGHAGRDGSHRAPDDQSVDGVRRELERHGRRQCVERVRRRRGFRPRPGRPRDGRDERHGLVLVERHVPRHGLVERNRRESRAPGPPGGRRPRDLAGPEGVLQQRRLERLGPTAAPPRVPRTPRDDRLPGGPALAPARGRDGPARVGRPPAREGRTVPTDGPLPDPRRRPADRADWRRGGSRARRARKFGHAHRRRAVRPRFLRRERRSRGAEEPDGRRARGGDREGSLRVPRARLRGPGAARLGPADRRVPRGDRGSVGRRAPALGRSAGGTRGPRRAARLVPSDGIPLRPSASADFPGPRKVASMIATSKPLSSAPPDLEEMAATRATVPEGPGIGLTLKIALAGDPGVGKSSLVRRFVSDTFDDRYVSTLGTKVSSRKFRVDDPRRASASIEVGASVWDVMGSLGFRELLKDAFFSNSQAVLYVCARTRPESLWSLLDWAAAVESVAGPTPAVLLVNKSDLEGPETISAADGDELCKARGWRSLDTSAKTGSNVEAAFRLVAQAYLLRVQTK